MAARGPLLDFPRDLSVQACYVVPAPIAKAVELHKQWSPTQNAELKVYLHGDISATPALSDFAKLGSAPNNGAVHNLQTATQKVMQNARLQMSAEEAKQYAKNSSFAAFWSNLLYQRALTFQSGGLAKQPAYNSAGKSIGPAEEASRLLREQPKVRAQFQPIIEQTPLGGGTGSVTPGQYWELFDVDGQGALSLGATYWKQSSDSWQSIDLQYYASSGYLVMITFYQLWPVTIDNKPATLVWRVDSISSNELGELRGMERMGSSAAMMKTIQKQVTLFLKDVSR